MRYPTYENPDSRPLVAAYIQLIGEREPDNRRAIDALPPASLERAGMLVARACLILAESKSAHNQKAGNKALHHAEIDIEKMMPLLDDKKFRSARQLAITTAMIKHRDDNRAINVLRERSHDEAIKSINSIHISTRRTKPLDSRKQLGGELAEHIGLAMLTRLGTNPHILARPALPHHDESKTSQPGIGARRNIDLTVVETGAGQPMLHTVQIKVGCLAYCGNTEDSAEEARDWQRGRYTSDISLVSKKCDMVMHPDSASSAFRPLSGFLRKEYLGLISPEEIRELDAATNGLLLAITGDEPLRHGARKPGEPLPQTGAYGSPFEILAAASAS